MGQKMPRPIEPRFQSPHRILEKASQQFLKMVRYKVNYGEKELIRLKQGTIYSQRYSHYLFFIEIIEIRLTKNLNLSYLIKDPSLFLFFMMEGNISFITNEGISITDATKGICYPSYNQPGEYFVHFPEGTHILFYISTRPGWLKTHLDIYPHFREFISRFEQNADLYCDLPQCPITREMRQFFRGLYKINPFSARHLEVSITNNCMGLYEEYHGTLTANIKFQNVSVREAIVKVIVHLNVNFTSEEVDDLSELFRQMPFTERTIRQQFFNQTKRTMHNYIEVLRMNLALDLVQNTTIPFYTIALQIGYNYHYHFSKIFKKHFGVTPKSARKTPRIPFIPV